MSSSFVAHLVRPLALSPPPTPPLHNPPQPQPQQRATLQALLSDLNAPLSPHLVHRTLHSLHSLSPPDPESLALKQAVVNRLLVALYAQAIEASLAQATDADTEAEWWADIERSHWNVVWYLLQTTPVRVANLGGVILQALRTQNLPVTASNLSPASIRRLFPSADPSRPNPLNKALFPHLHHQSFSITSSTILFSSSTSIPSREDRFSKRVWSILNPLISWSNLPIQLARQECHFKRRELEKIRDQKAEALGRLAHMRGDLATAVKDPRDVQPFIYLLSQVVQGLPFDAANVKEASFEASNLFTELANLSATVFTVQSAEASFVFDSISLRRPSWLTLAWPRLLLLPPLTLYALRAVFANKATLIEVARDARETVTAFVRSWLVDPLKDVIKTVRAGGEDGVIVRKEAVMADLDSLERMALSLAKDELGYRPEQMDALSAQIKNGDLTPVLRLYEEDIRSPLRSAVTGTLLRSVFIQIQKAKVDIDQALAGIDRLLKSQELTFAFVGVAPALGITYLFGGALLNLVRGGTGRGKYGGRRKRAGAWSAMRRVERHLMSQRSKHHHNHRDDMPLPPLTSGLLLLSVARLRTYAETSLPAQSRLREGFLEDVVDLEDPDLGRAEKMRVVERMWRCWGDVLGWTRIVGGAA